MWWRPFRFNPIHQRPHLIFRSRVAIDANLRGRLAAATTNSRKSPWSRATISAKPSPSASAGDTLAEKSSPGTQRTGTFVVNSRGTITHAAPKSIDGRCVCGEKDGVDKPVGKAFNQKLALSGEEVVEVESAR
jgi:hypothetical protein